MIVTSGERTPGPEVLASLRAVAREVTLESRFKPEFSDAIRAAITGAVWNAHSIETGTGNVVPFWVTFIDPSRRLPQSVWFELTDFRHEVPPCGR